MTHNSDTHPPVPDSVADNVPENTPDSVPDKTDKGNAFRRSKRKQGVVPVENLLVEERVFRPLPRVAANATVNPQDMRLAQQQADQDYYAFWEEAAEELEWYRRWESVIDDTDAPFYRWFSGARCNIVHNALDRHIESANKNKLALVWEGEPGDYRKLTYFELYREVNKFANVLRGMGVRKGDRVLVYMPSLPETVIAMLASAKVGAVHSVVYAGFSARALAGRISDAQPRIIVTVDGFYRNGRVVPLKPIVDQALSSCCSMFEKVVVVHRAHVEVDMDDARDVWWHDEMRAQTAYAETEVMDSADPLFMLYTSGTTGKPKGIVHSHGGYMVGVNRSFHWVFDIKATDTFWSTADTGWITGHSYTVYGPLMAGTTTFLYEGHPLYPEAGRLWSMVERWGITILYTVPTLIRMLMRFGASYPAQHDISSLRLLGTVGEPISPEAWVWFHKHIGQRQCPLLDTWWQTETGHIMISPLPVSLLKPGSVTRPLPGIYADVLDDEGNSVAAGEGGSLVMTKPWPGMMSGVFNDPVAYVDLYWSQYPGMFFTGDVARKDGDGYIWVQGRSDDVIMIAGHRVGTAELEAAFASHPAVAECAVIGVPDDIRGEVVKAYVVLHDDVPQVGGFITSEETQEDFIMHVRRELGPVAVIREVEIRDALPKNRSGKIMRRVLRAEEFDRDAGDLSTLEEEPDVVR